MRVCALPGNTLPFGVAVEGYTDDDLEALKKLVFAKLVVVVRGQGHLSPAAQLALTKSFDGGESYGHGSNVAVRRATLLSLLRVC